MVKFKLIILASAPLSLFAQEKPSDTINAQPPQKWVQSMNNYITLKLTQSSDVETLGVETGTNSIHLSPNSKSTTRLTFGYRFLTYSIKYSAKFLPGNDDDDIRGKTKGGGMGFGFNFKHWQQSLSYSKTSGYYLENTSDYDPGWTNGKPYIQFPNLIYKNYEGITAYNFNPNFSVSAVATQSTRQLKSAGSFIPHALYRYYIIDDQSPITGTTTTQKTNNFEFLVGAGYYYTYVLKQSFYVSLGLTPAAGIVFNNFDTRSVDETIHTKEKNAIFRLDGRAGLGYNGQRFFSGVYMKISGSEFKQGSSTAITEDNRVVFQAFLGYRLNAPKWMREPVQAVMDKAGFK